jgi:hypothetical protein
MRECGHTHRHKLEKELVRTEFSERAEPNTAREKQLAFALGAPEPTLSYPQSRQVGPESLPPPPPGGGCARSNRTLYRLEEIFISGMIQCNSMHYTLSKKGEPGAYNSLL